LGQNAVEVVARLHLLLLRQRGVVADEERVVAVDAVAETAARDGSKDRVLGEHRRVHRGALLVLRQRDEVLTRVDAVDVRLVEDASGQRVLLHAKVGRCAPPECLLR